jgi:hypothetical protein
VKVYYVTAERRFRFRQSEGFDRESNILPSSHIEAPTIHIARSLKKMADPVTVKTSWADDVEVEEFEPPKIEDYVDENGIRVTVEYTVNDEGKKVKVRNHPDRRVSPAFLPLSRVFSRLRGRPSVCCKNLLSIMPSRRGNNGQNLGRRKVPNLWRTRL